MADDEPTFAEKLSALKRAYDEQLGGRIEALENAHQEIGGSGSNNNGEPALKVLLDLAHKLAGSADTFGYKDLSTSALNLENRCQQLINDGHAPDADGMQELSELIAVCSRYATR